MITFRLAAVLAKCCSPHAKNQCVLLSLSQRTEVCAVSVMQLELRDSTVSVWAACHLPCCGLSCLSPVLLRSELLSLSCRGLGRRQAPRHPAQFSFVMLTREASDRGHIARSLSAASRSGQRDAASYRAPRGGPARRPQTGAQH